MPAPAKAKENPNEALPLEERIRSRAYELYLARGNESGSELDDWLQAEDEIPLAEEEARDERLTYLTETTAAHWSPER